MRDLPGLPRGSILGYCTNVHAGASAMDALFNLTSYAPAVRKWLQLNEPMGIGLWFGESAAHALFQKVREGDHTLRDWFQENDLVPFSFNGFPFGDFHNEEVKHKVYEPSWAEVDRWGFTLLLACLHVEFAGNDTQVERSISTLPLGWPQLHAPVELPKCVDRLLNCTQQLRNQFGKYGIVTHIDLEPEPGCILQTSSDVVQFILEHLLPSARKLEIEELIVLHHIRVCHDICHAAVMFEDQQVMFDRYRNAGIKVGKVQISNAIRVPFDEYSESERHEALRQLSAFAEDRYLHQTMIRFDDGTMQFFEDLPLAIQSVPANQTARGEWRVHFHVPVYLESFGLLKTTRDHIIECMKLLQDSDVHHWEVETYAWDVLPPELKVADLADGIAKELLWVKEQAAQLPLPPRGRGSG